MKNSLSIHSRCQVADFTLGKTSSKALCAASRDAYRRLTVFFTQTEKPWENMAISWRKSWAKTQKEYDFMAKIIENPWDLCMIGQLDLDIDIELENLWVYPTDEIRGRISWNAGI